MKLYELSEAWRSIESLEDESYTAALDQIKGEFADKAENIAKLIREADAEAQAFQDEAGRMFDKAKAAVNRSAHLKEYLKQNMEAIGIDKIPGAVLTVSLQKSPPALDMTEDAVVPQEFLRHIPERYEPDRKGIIDYWRSTGALPEGVKGVEVRESRHVRIR